MRHIVFEWKVNPSLDHIKRTSLLPTLDKLLEEAKRTFPRVPINKLVIDIEEQRGRRLPRIILREKTPGKY